MEITSDIFKNFNFDKPKTSFSRRDYPVVETDFSKNLKPCDIILYRAHGKDDFTGWTISHLTYSPYSHTEIHIMDGYSLSANWNGVGYNDLYEHAKCVDIFRLNRELTREERMTICAKATQSLLKPYDYSNLVLFPFASKDDAMRMSLNNAYICSELAEWIYSEAGIDFVVDKPNAIMAPADIGRSDILNWVGTFLNGEKIAGYQRNAFLPEQEDKLAEFIAGVMGAFTNADEVYKELARNGYYLKGKD
jgi:hypothetical protein